MLSGVNAKRITASGVIGPTGNNKSISKLCGVLVQGAGTAGTASVYDGEGTSGTLLYVIDVAADSTKHIDHGCPVAIQSGQIHVELDTTDPTAVTVFWA